MSQELELDLELPFGSVAPETKDPRMLLILSNIKTGKTSSCLDLPNSFLIDLEDSSGFFTGNYRNLRKISGKHNIPVGKLFLDYAEKIKQANHKAGKPVYDFITIDTLSALEKLAKLKATADYKKTVAGKNFTGADVTKELPKGAGFALMADALFGLVDLYKSLPGKCLILLGHKKLSTISKGNQEIDITEIDLTGKNKHIMAIADSIGYMYRSKENQHQNIMSFRKDDGDSIWGSRSPHLSNKTFVFSTKNPETDKVQNNWDLIFTSLASKNTQKMIEIEETSKTNTTEENYPE